MKNNKSGAIILCTCLVLCVLALSGCNTFNLYQMREATPTTQTTYRTPTTSSSSVISTPTTTDTPLPLITSDSLQLVCQDDFNNPDSGWSVRSDQDVSYSYTNGEYNISVNDSKYLYSAWNGAVGTQDNFVVDVDARVLSPVDTSRYGILFRRDDNGECYGFMISGNYYWVDKHVLNDWQYLQDSTESQYS
jgi:hypothetical protein